MIKIEVNTVQDKINFKSEVRGTRLDLTAEIYAMLKAFEKNYPQELDRAVKLLCIEHQEEKDD